MANNPQNRKLSDQFGAITGPSESELTDIEQGGEDSWYTPERIEQFRADYAHVDPNYSALRNSRARTRGTGTTDYGVSRAADKTAAAAGESEFFVGSEGTGGFKNTGGSSDFDKADTHGSYRGAGAGSWDIPEAGARASSFDRIAPRSKEESVAKEQGMFYLRLAGPTCNHPICSAYRARGTEMVERFLGNDRVLSREDYGTAQNPEQAIPSVRTDKKVAPYVLRPESADVPFGQRKGSFGTGKTDDFGDFQPDKKNPVMTPVTQVMDSNHPQYKSLMAQYRTLAGAGERPLFHPDDYLEHHHAPGEENFKLPWEA